MEKRRKMSVKNKKDAMIAILLAVCLLFGVAILVLVEKNVGTPIFYNGKMENICVRINEVCSSNRSIIASETGEFHDYIELYNYGETFNLADFGLANDTANGTAYKFGDIEFKANSYLVVFLDGTKIPFRLNSDGNEYIALVAWDGTVIDKVNTVAMRSNEVMLYDNGSYTVSDEASPGYPNTKQGLADFREGISDANLPIVINEILTANGSALPDEYGEFSDVIELKNISASIVSLKSFFISDTLEERNRCALPDKELAPGELFVIFASGRENSSKNDNFHANFRLSEGETVVISNGAKHFSKDVENCNTNCSQSRVSGENGIEYVQMSATPGFENDEAGIEALDLTRINGNAQLVINEVLLSQDMVAYGGKLRDVIEICNVSSETVTTDGWFISDSLEEPYRFELPKVTLKPDECIVLFAEKGVGDNVCGFALSSGDMLYITGPDFKRSEFVPCAPAGEGKSRIRVVEDGEAVYVSGETSVGFANNDDGIAKYQKAVRPSDVEISEAVAFNTKYLAGPYKTYHDFVELHNRSVSEITLDGWYLSDDSEEPKKGSLDGVTIPPNGYVVIILSSEGLNVPSGYKSLPFSLSSSGETLCLSKSDKIVDCMAIPSVGQNTSYGRAADSDGFSILTEATPKAKNASGVRKKSASPTASLPQGVYDDEAITVELKGKGDIYYTLDCSEPTSASTLYTSPIRLTKTSVIRCASLEEGKGLSEISDLTYVINEPDTLETVTIVTTPENLWDYYTGIYETGPRASSTFPYENANYYYRWEKEATVSFFDKEGGGFSESCGLRIFGGLSRALPKKSFAVFFRSAYGNGQLNYQLFEDDELSVYEALVLRNTGQDYHYSSMRDAMITEMAHDMLGIDVQNYRPVVVYLNGEYWGLYFIREKLNENYVAGHYNVSSDEAEVAVANGRTSESYMALVDYASGHDLKIDEHYKHVCSLMDVENYADYIVAQIIIANTDNGNIRFFTYEGGKWRWIMYDVDHAFRASYYNTVADHLDPGGTGGGNNFSTRLINALLKNPEFKKMFLTKMAWQMNNVWTPENVAAYVEKFKGMIENDIQRDRTRWDKSYDQWVSSVESLNKFIVAREAYMLDHVKAKFSLSDSEMKSYGFKV